jgi:Ca2+-binding EF-hand superfamily protein
MDDDNSSKIDLAEFTKGMAEHALDWTPAQVKAVFDLFDADKSGGIDISEFLFGVRGTLNERRCQLVLMAFEILDADGSGFVELNDISAKYCADKHHDVISGKRSKEEILSEFLGTFDTIDKDGKVTPAEFLKYYGNVSSSIDDDDYFELMMRNAWHISGGEGWCANSSNMRVLVGHTDGRATVEEVNDDLGIIYSDKEKIVSVLVAQGISDIEFIQGNDGIKYTPGSKAAAPASAPSTPARVQRVSDVSAAEAPAQVQNMRRHNGAGRSTLQLF